MFHVLLVDDDQNFRRSLLIQLELEGFYVTEVQSGDEALVYLEEHFQSQHDIPDVVISDIKMEGINGTQLFEKIKQNYPLLSVILISAFEFHGELEGCPFLKKPFSIQQMLSIMNQSIQHH